MRLARAARFALLIALGCVATARDRGPEIATALGALAAAGFEFDADVRFRMERYAVCEGFACADLVLIAERRTIVLAPDAFESPARLRGSLLEVWERYREPRPGSLPDLARGSLRVIRDGRRVGVDDVHTLRLAHHSYRQLWNQLTAEQRSDLEDPDRLVFP